MSAWENRIQSGFLVLISVVFRNPLYTTRNVEESKNTFCYKFNSKSKLFEITVFLLVSSQVIYFVNNACRIPKVNGRPESSGLL